MITTRSRKTWIGRILATGAAVAASVMLSTTTAHAYIAPGPAYYTGTPSVVQTSMTCGSGQILISPVASVQANYVRGQWATYRYALYAGGRHVTTSGWSAAKLLPYEVTSWGANYTYARSPLPASRINVTSGYWEVAVQVGWYTSYGWSYSQWMVPDGYSSGMAGLGIPNNGYRKCVA